MNVCDSSHLDCEASPGFPIDDLRTLLALWSDKLRASAEVKELARAARRSLGRKAAVLQSMRDCLLELAARCSGDQRPERPIIEQLEALAFADRRFIGRMGPPFDDCVSVAADQLGRTNG